MDWFRSYHGAPMDPKWLTVARRAGTNAAAVSAIWWSLMDYASQNDERGSIDGFDAETADGFFGLELGTTDAVIDALRERKCIVENWIAKWEKRQPKREDGSSERAKAWRERKKSEQNDNERNRTQPNATERQIRGEEIREEPPPTPSVPVADAQPEPKIRRASPEAAAVAKAFLESRERHFPNELRFPAPRYTLESEAQDMLGRGWPADLIVQAVEAGMERAAADAAQFGKTTPGSLKAFHLSIQDAVARQKKAEATAIRGATAGYGRQAGSAAADADTAMWEARLNQYRRHGSWNDGKYGPRPGCSGCRVPAAMLSAFLAAEQVAA